MILDPVKNTASGPYIFYTPQPNTWGGTDFYQHHIINYGFDHTVGMQLGEENSMYTHLQVWADFLEPGSPATTIDFSSTATYYATELREATFDEFGNVVELGSELNLIDPSTGASLLESASGSNYSVPEPATLGVLLSGGLALLRRRR